MLELQWCGTGWQEHGQPHHVLRVWRWGTMELVAEIPIPLLRQIVGHYLSQAHLTAAVMQTERKPLASAPARARPLALGPPQKATREAHRRSRMARKRNS